MGRREENWGEKEEEEAKAKEKKKGERTGSWGKEHHEGIQGEGKYKRTE